MKKTSKPVQGSLLISEPFLLDSYFKRAVVLLSEHDSTGTLGFILNKPTDVKLNDAVEDFPPFDVPPIFKSWVPSLETNLGDVRKKMTIFRIILLG